MPNLYKILEENPAIRAAIIQDDGGIYGLPAAGSSSPAPAPDQAGDNVFSLEDFF